MAIDPNNPFYSAFADAIAKRDGANPNYRIKPKHIITNSGTEGVVLGYHERRRIGVLKVRPVLVPSGLGYRRSAIQRKTNTERTPS